MTDNLDTEIINWVAFAKGMGESLADVIRHDQDHDDWHAMHGDAPCTSEADCAAKRAKYAEVQAEAGITKGDLPGHAFHGNQYAQVAALAQRLPGAVRQARANYAKTMGGTNVVKDFKKISLQHHSCAHFYAVTGDRAAQEMHEHAALLLGLAAKGQDDISRNRNSTPADFDNQIRLENNAESASRQAADLSSRLAEVGKSAGIQKGDTPGHPFHGNQWTGGQGGGRHDEAVGHLRTLQQTAAAGQGRGVRRSTDALGRHFKAAPYGSTISGHVGLQNWRIAGEAKALADKIDQDRSKSVEEHLNDARNGVAQLRQEAVQNSKFDNYDTAKGLREQAAVLQGVIDHVSSKMGIAKSVGEIQKEEAGHEFHGNQWSQGAGGGKAPYNNPRRVDPSRYQVEPAQPEPHATGEESGHSFMGNHWVGTDHPAHPDYQG